jgi:hypothetical protein
MINLEMSRIMFKEEREECQFKWRMLTPDEGRDDHR